MLKCKQMNLEALDIIKAYYTVNREVLYKKMRRNGDQKINEKIIRIVTLLFDTIILKWYSVGDFLMRSGKKHELLQGLKLKPIPYNIFMNE
jgi:hypothetical protein